MCLRPRNDHLTPPGPATADGRLLVITKICVSVIAHQHRPGEGPPTPPPKKKAGAFSSKQFKNNLVES